MADNETAELKPKIKIIIPWSVKQDASCDEGLILELDDSDTLAILRQLKIDEGINGN